MALFSGEVKLDVVVKAGEFDVVATPVVDENGELEVNKGSVLGDDVDAFVEVESVSGNTINLSKMAPGDWISFQIKVENNSDIAVKCQPKIVNEGDLAQYITIEWKTENGQYTSDTDSIMSIPAYDSANPENSTKIFDVRITLSKDTTTAQGAGKEANVTYYVEAWQGNVETNPNNNP